MPQETKSRFDHESPDEFGPGSRIEADDPNLPQAIEAATAFRGDVTITCRGDGREIAGYLFDHRAHDDPKLACVRLMEKKNGTRLVIAYADIAVLEFTGRDTAAGKSFETWMKKYVQKKFSGEEANLESESLEED
ncbi:MAG: hypothetical protein O7G85_10535 [Planctomycetota bacterium]|nr:hypothetical protein [Planctomycetota bacterium]